MGSNSTDISYHFGQMGSGHIKDAASDLKPPHGRVIVAIQCLESVAFSHLEPDTSFNSTLVDSSDSYGDGVAFVGTTNGNTRANGLDNSDSSAESVNIASTVIFPTGTMLYGRWKRVSLNADMTHGVIVYYGK
jgi:hypothetical protein|tara:strand:+ start:758 stop:1156 length:399 start_codon:yes stop_codon:yes gene_type:complete